MVELHDGLKGAGGDDRTVRVVSSPLVRRHFQMCEAEERGVSTGLTVMTPGDLARRLLSLIPAAPRLASPASELNLLWRIARKKLADSPFKISPITLRSFLINLLATLKQLKQFNLEMPSLEKVERSLDAGYTRNRWAFVASLYADYEEALSKRGLVGDVGVFHYVARHARRVDLKRLGIRRIVLHHLVDMTPAQAVMFRALKDSGVEVRLAVAPIPAVSEPAFEDRLRTLIGEINIDFIPEATSLNGLHIEEVIAPTAVEEARWCARRVRALLRAGVAPHRVLVLFRRPTVPPNSLCRHFADFNVALAGAESAASAAAARRLLFAVADLALNDFPRWSMSLILDAYRASADLPSSWLEEVFSLPAEEDSTEEDALAPVIWRGYERWRKRLASVAHSDEAVALLNRIHDLRGKSARTFAEGCRDIAFFLGGASEPLRETLDEATKSMIFALEVAQESGATETQTIEILRSLGTEAEISGGVEPEKTGWGEFPDLLGITSEHNFLLGVSDTQVPAPPPVPFVLSSSERQRVNSILGCEVFLSRESHLLRERLFFESALATAGSSVTVFRPSLIHNAPQYESPLLRMLKVSRGWNISSVSFTMRESLQPSPKDVESLDDALRSLARVPHPSLAADIAAEEQRLSAATFADRQRLATRLLVPGFDGVIPRDALPEAIRDYGATREHAASPTGLARYGKCPFVFFAEKILRLADLPEEDAPPTLTLGSLLHRVLENAIQPIIRNEATWEDFPALSEKEAEREFSRCDPLTFRGNLNVLKESIVRFAQWETREMMEVSQGAKRGFANRPASIIPVNAEQRVSGAISLRSGLFYLRGKVDRVDRVDGDPEACPTLLLSDYKAGIVPETSKPRQSLQLPLYALLLSGRESDPIPLRDIGFRYVSVGRLESKPALSTALRRGVLVEKYEEAKAASEDIIRNIRAGLFTPFPQFGNRGSSRDRSVPHRLRKEKFVCENCSYLSVCRISLLNGVRKDLSPFNAQGQGADFGAPETHGEPEESDE